MIKYWLNHKADCYCDPCLNIKLKNKKRAVLRKAVKTYLQHEKPLDVKDGECV